MVDNFIKWSVCQKCLVWQEWKVIKPLEVRGTSYWCTNSSHFLATIMVRIWASLEIFWLKKRENSIFASVEFVFQIALCDTLRWRLHACLYSSYGSFITVHLCHAKHFHHTATACGHAVAYCMYCVSAPDLLTLWQQQSGRCQLQDLGFTITMHPFLQALPSKLGG